jgi:hypothetical protein
MMPSDREAALSWKLWEMTLDGHGAECVVNSGRRGIEMQFLLDGKLLSSYRSDRADEVLEWAADRRRRMETRGWRAA